MEKVVSIVNHSPARVQRYIESRYARVGSGEVMVIRGANSDGGHGLKTILTSGERRGARPKVKQVLAF